MSSMLQDPDGATEEAPPVYFVELSKSGRAECKKCDGKIENKSLRIGIMIDGEWGLMTRWQHLDCTVFPKSIPSVEDIDGFRELSAQDKILVTERFNSSANEVDDDSIPVNPDELVRNAWDQPLEPSSDLLMPLLPYQKEGLGWMVNQEQNEVHGGILADEMGMGKTIQAISLMLHNRPDTTEFQQMREWAASDERHGIKEDLPRAGTLIVLPTVAIRQWQTEIARFTRGGVLTVKVYHGSDRNTSAKELTGVDVVLTSYKILEIEYRKATAGTKVTCKLCGKKFYPDKLRVHRKYFCGEDAQRTEAQSLTQRKQQRPANAFGRPDTPGKSAVNKASTSKGTSSSSGSAKKRRKVDTAVGSDDNEEDEDSSEDEVARQKRQIKERKAAEEAKKTAKAAKAASAKAASTAKTVESKGAAKTPVAGKKAPVKSRASPQSKQDYWKDSGGDSDNQSDADGGGSEEDSPPVSTKKAPARNARTAANSKSTTSKVATASTKSSGSSTVKRTATPDASSVSANTSDTGGSVGASSAVKRRSPRTQAQVQRSYRVDTSGSDTGDAESAYDSEEAAKSEQAAEEEDAGASSDSNCDATTSDEDDQKYRAAVKGRGKGSVSRATPSKAKQTPPKFKGSAAKSRGTKGSTAVESASKAASKTASTVNSAVKPGKGKANAADTVGIKRTRTMKVESDDDASDGEPEGAGDSDGSGSDDGAGKAAASDEDSEVERDIQEAIAEAARALAKSKAQPPKSILHMLSWFRIILDEAHLIKDRSTSTAKAVFNLVSLNKWCLTGTPLQNRVGELYSLIRFLRIDPHAFYYCRSKGCECKSLHYRFTKSRCDECSHSVIQHYCHFNKHILNPIKRAGYVSEGRRAMLKLKQQVLDEILLRRTKTTRAEDIQLPPRVVKVRQEKLDEKEEDFYSALYTQSQAQFNTYLQSGTVLNNYAHIFDILIRLRQAVDHPYLVIYSEAQTATKKDSNDFLNVANDVVVKTEKGDCDLCHEPWEDPVTAQCGHCFCRPCITDYIAAVSNGSGGNSSGGLRCPDCDVTLTIQLNGASNGGRVRGSASRSSGANGSSKSLQDLDTTAGASGAGSGEDAGTSVWDADKAISRRSILDKIDLSLFQSSTKIEALMEELYKMQSEDLGAKAIVFSQFVNMLDIINYRVQRGGIACVKLSGSMNLEQRDKAITAFKTDPAVKVMLISLKAGGVALNLTVASRIFLMDPWWNPAAEMQAIDRTHRIGQFKPIYATRFIIENTIEERILRLQDKKKLVFDGTVGGDAGSMSKLTVDDMRFLFN